MPADPDTNIPIHFRTMYSENMKMLLSNGGSLLRGTFEEGPVEGETQSVVDQFGTTRGQRADTRFGDNPMMDVNRARRWVDPEKWDVGVPIDKWDKLKAVLDPTSKLLKSIRDGIGENLDYDVMIPAFFAKAKIGKTGTETEAFDTTNAVIADTLQPDGSTGTSTGLNVKKVQAGVAKMKGYKVKVGLEQLHMAITSVQWDNLFDDVKVIHGDYISGEALRTGKVPGLFGINFHDIEDLTKVATLRHCPLWVESGMHLGIQDEPFSDIWKLTGKKNIPYVYASVIAGATRTEQGKVIRIDCKE